MSPSHTLQQQMIDDVIHSAAMPAAANVAVYLTDYQHDK